MKFRVGQKVKVVSKESIDSSINQIGDIGTIKAIEYKTLIQVHVRGRINQYNWHTEEELISERQN